MFFTAAATIGGGSFSALKNKFFKRHLCCEKTLLFLGMVIGNTFYFMNKTKPKNKKMNILKHLCVNNDHKVLTRE
jgi:hypothetical protein